MEDGNSTSVSTAALVPSSPSSYVSCIKVDGRPILPPVMTEERRAEMRMYREIAVLRQKERQQIKDFDEYAGSVSSISVADEDEEDVEDGRPLTSTPKKFEERPVSACSSDLENLPKSSDSSEEEEESSASTGTFIIRRKQSEVTAVEQEAPPEELQEPGSPSELLYTKRKRPTKYFDTRDEEEVEKGLKQQQQELQESADSSFASTTLSKYIAGCDRSSLSMSSMSNITTPGETSVSKSFSQFLPNSVPEEESAKNQSSSSSSGGQKSFTINTDFLSLSKLSLEDKDKRSPPLKAVRRSARKKFFDSPETQSPDDEGSDKENILEDNALSNSASKGHVRKLSYTLSEPCEALLSAGLNSPPSAGQGLPGRLPLSPIPQSAPNTPNLKTYRVEEALHKEEGQPEDVKDGKTSPESGKGEALDKLELLMSRYEQMKVLFEAEKVKILQEIGEASGQQIQKRSTQKEENTEVLDLSKKSVEKLRGDYYHPPASSSSSVSVILSETSNLRNFFCPIPNSPESTSSRVTSDLQSHSTSAASPRVTTSGLALLQSIRGQKRLSSKPVSISDAASPLLKGLVIPPEEVKGHEQPRKPKSSSASVQIDEVLNVKLCKVSAAAKGFLVRRLLHTERVQSVVATIRDTVALLLSLYDEHKITGKGTPDDDLHKRLLQQLTAACTSFHDVFFKLSTRERMAIISNDREKLKAKALNMKMSSSQQGGRRLTDATLRSLERRLTLENSPVKSKTTTSRRKTYTTSHSHSSRFSSRQSYAANSANSSNTNSNDPRVAMKRRRLSTAAVLTNRDTNGNMRRPSTSGALTFDRAQHTVTPREFLSARQHMDAPWGSTTFVVPESRRVTNVPSNSNSSRLSSRMSVSSVTSTHSSKAPWK